MQFWSFLWGMMGLWDSSPRETKPDVNDTTPPNILLMVADDLGWNDVSWHNPAIFTPNLETLAREGVILESNYVQQLCTPSRASLMTGRYPHRLGMQHGILKKSQAYGLPLNVTLLPEQLRRLGYATHMVGKWHLGFCKWEYTPTNRGFDSFYGFYTGNIDYYTHKSGKEKGLDFRYNKDVLKNTRGQFSTSLYAARATELIRNHDSTKPLFLYMPFQSPHMPNQAPDKFLDMYSHIRNEGRRTHSAKISAMDDAAGQILSALMQRNMMENTVIIFMSDNGATPSSGGSNWPLRGTKGTLWEGGTRVPAFFWSSKLTKRRYVNKGMIHIVDWLPTILSLAGGKPADGDLDGVDQSPMLLDHAPSSREELVYNINHRNGRAAIRMGKYKLIEGSPGGYNDWYTLPSRLSNRRPEKDKTHRDTNLTVLYDLEADPSETFDLAWKRPHVVSRMRARLDEHRQHSVPVLSNLKVKKAHPKFHGGAWSPGWC